MKNRKKKMRKGKNTISERPMIKKRQKYFKTEMMEE